MSETKLVISNGKLVVGTGVGIVTKTPIVAPFSSLLSYEFIAGSGNSGSLISSNTETGDIEVKSNPSATPNANILKLKFDNSIASGTNVRLTFELSIVDWGSNEYASYYAWSNGLTPSINQPIDLEPTTQPVTFTQDVVLDNAIGREVILELAYLFSNTTIGKMKAELI